VLNSRAREDSAIHLDDKNAVARSIEQHRGAIPNAMDFAPELHARDSLGAPNNAVDIQLDDSLARDGIEILGLTKTGELETNGASPAKEPELKIADPTPTKTYDFDLEM